MSTNRVREATHAGSWYTASKRELDSELEGYLAKVPSDNIKGVASHKEDPGVEFPVVGARAIIAPYHLAH
jgi:MEMO1 family protein